MVLAAGQDHRVISPGLPRNVRRKVNGRQCDAEDIAPGFPVAMKFQPKAAKVASEPASSATRATRRWPFAADRHHSRGQGLVEFALVLPVLAVIFVAILQFGVLFSAQVGITNAVREAVRNASAIPVATSTDAGTAAQSVYDRLTDPSTGLLKRNGSSYSTAALVTTVTTGSPRTQVCYYSYTDATGGISIMARVEVQYRHPLFIPLISGILDGFDGVTDQAYRLGTSEEIRVSNGPLTSNGGIGGSGSPTCNS